jgi:uncharacterized DUF497 family protein
MTVKIMAKSECKSIGKTKTDNSVLLVVNTIRQENIRIISARRASTKERQIYYEKIGF